MKPLAFIFALVAVVGCSSVEESDLCARMEKAYSLYQASLLSGREVSKDEANAAAAAATYLTLYCGWQGQKAVTDVNGVAIVAPPK